MELSSNEIEHAANSNSPLSPIECVCVVCVQFTYYRYSDDRSSARENVPMICALGGNDGWSKQQRIYHWLHASILIEEELMRKNMISVLFHVD